MIVYYTQIHEGDRMWQKDADMPFTVTRIGEPRYDNTVTVWGKYPDGTNARVRLRCTEQYQVERD